MEGSTDIGGSRVALTMQLAESLEIPVTDIKPTIVDTDSDGYNNRTYGSRTTYATGWAAYQLGQELKIRMIAEAAKVFEVDYDKVTYSNSIFSTGDKKMTFKELAGKLLESSPPVTVSTSVRPRKSIPGFTTQIVDIEVDPETG